MKKKEVEEAAKRTKKATTSLAVFSIVIHSHAFDGSPNGKLKIEVELYICCCNFT